MAINRPRDKHKELVRIIALWGMPDHSDRHADVSVIQVMRFERENGDVYVVDKVVERRKAAALKAGGSGIMHRVIAHKVEEQGQTEPSPQAEYRLYLDGIDWYIELDFEDDQDWEQQIFPVEQQAEPEPEPIVDDCGYEPDFPFVFEEGDNSVIIPIVDAKHIGKLKPLHK